MKCAFEQPDHHDRSGSLPGAIHYSSPNLGFAPPPPLWFPAILSFFVAVSSRWAIFLFLMYSGQMPFGPKMESQRLFKYDAVWHWYIAQNGYDKASGPVGYADLITHYSWTWPKILSLSLFFPDHAHFVAILINIVIFGLAASVLALLALKASLPWWKPVVLLCCYPTAFFANSVYNEPIFLLLTFSSMLCLFYQRPFFASLLDASALTVRVNAWANAAATLYCTWRQRLPLRWCLAIAALMAAGASVQPCAVWYYRGSPTEHWKDFERVEWMANPQSVPFKDPYNIVSSAISRGGSIWTDDVFVYNSLIPSLSLFFAAFCLMAGWRWLPPPIRVQGLATVLGLSLLEQAISTPRYLMAFLPFYFLAGRCPSWVLGSVCVLSVWAQSVLVSRFLSNLWAF